MRKLIGLVLVVSSLAFAVRVMGELRVFATPDGGQVVAFGADAGTSTFIMQNVGTAPLNVSTVTLLGDDSSVFSLGTVPTLLSAGTQAQVEVHFQPTSPGTYAARVVIKSDAPQNSDVVLCAPAPCNPPQPPPENVGPPTQRGCTSIGLVAPALAILLMRRRRR